MCSLFASPCKVLNLNFSMLTNLGMRGRGTLSQSYRYAAIVGGRMMLWWDAVTLGARMTLWWDAVTLGTKLEYCFIWNLKLTCNLSERWDVCTIYEMYINTGTMFLLVCSNSRSKDAFVLKFVLYIFDYEMELGEVHYNSHTNQVKCEKCVQISPAA